jgi:hypothetical protein
MGYTTSFEGQFKITPPLTLMELRRIEDLHDPETRTETNPGIRCPSGYCQWTPTRMGDGLKWDGGEKVYEYVEWLEVVVSLLDDLGHEVSGSIKWAGETSDDRGVLAVIGRTVKATKHGRFAPGATPFESAVNALKAIADAPRSSAGDLVEIAVKGLELATRAKKAKKS